MGQLYIQKRLYGSEALKCAFKYLEREHQAIIFFPKEHKSFYEYEVRGVGIPKGEFNVRMKELVPGVYLITLEQ